MSNPTPALHLLCGKIAAGKSTLARELTAQPKTVLISEDEWLTHLYPGELGSLADYLRLSRRLRIVVEKHAIDLLRAGVSVVLDFPANTPQMRLWMRELAQRAQVEHFLHFLDVPDSECKARLAVRNETKPEGLYWAAVSEEIFDQVTRYFVPPSLEEGFNVVKR